MLDRVPSRVGWVDSIAERVRARGPVAWSLVLAERDDPARLLSEILARLWLTEPGAADATAVGEGPAVLFRYASTGLTGPAELELMRETFDAVQVGALPRQTSLLPPDGPANPADDGPLEPVLGRLLGGRSVWLVLEDADRLAADSALRRALENLWNRARASALPLHVLVHTRAAPSPAAATTLSILDADTLPPPPPITLHDLGTALPDWEDHRIITARAVFGADARVWRRIDPRLTLSGNIVSLLFDPDSRIFDVGARDLLRDVSKPERYGGIVRALASGAREWGEIVDRGAGLASASQLGPYMKALEESGWIRTERSLDAGPRSRRSRYVLVDDLHAFWFRCVLPVRSRIVAGENRRRLWSQAVKPLVRPFVASRITGLVRTEMVARPLIGWRAREIGGLWGDGYDLSVSGTLENGGTFHGVAFWDRTPPDDTLVRMQEQMRETRYGFGRQARLRLVFAREAPDHDWVRRMARASDAFFLGPDALVGRA